MNRVFCKAVFVAIILDILANFLFLWILGFAMPIWTAMLIGGINGIACTAYYIKKDS